MEHEIEYNFWDIYLDGQLIDSVSFEYDIDEETVKSSLINHDGYDPNIIVRLAQ
jgi:hypothetical protein